MPLAPEPQRLASDSIALVSFLQSIGSYTGPELILNPDRPLFHYTDLAGLLGIIHEGSLWMTQSRYSNDDEEMRHGQRVAQEAIGVAKSDPAFAALPNYLDEVSALLHKPAPEGVYVCSFCEKDNLLSQWRGYAANGTGVCLQFDPSGFGSWTGPDCPHGQMRLWRVFYDEGTQQKILRGALQHAFSMGPGSIPEAAANRAADAIEFFTPTFKNPDFKEESESRLIFTPLPSCQVPRRFRVSRGMLVPFFTLKDLGPPAPANALPTPLPLKGVTVGPSPRKELNVDSVRAMLKQAGYPNVPVTASQTPYRA